VALKELCLELFEPWADMKRQIKNLRRRIQEKKDKIEEEEM